MMKTDGLPDMREALSQWSQSIDKEYYVLNEFNYVALCDDHFTEEYEVYANEMDFIENFKIDGKPLIDLIDELEYVEPE